MWVRVYYGLVRVAKCMFAYSHVVALSDVHQNQSSCDMCDGAMCSAELANISWNCLVQICAMMMLMMMTMRRRMYICMDFSFIHFEDVRIISLVSSICTYQTYLCTLFILICTKKVNLAGACTSNTCQNTF